MRRAITTIFAIGFASVASAQHERPAGGLMLSGDAGYLSVNFKESAKAVTGSSGGATFGGGAGFILGDHLFFSVGARVFNKDGERVFVAEPGGTVFKLGHPLQLRLVPAQLTIGWRFFEKRVLNFMLTPYLGAGGDLTSYHEESTIAGEARTFDVKKAGVHGLAGVELGGRQLRLAVEASYASVPNAIGDSPNGVSKVYGESNIGGFTVLGKIVFITGR